MVTVSIVAAADLANLTAFAFNLCRNASLADDAVQSAISRILERIHKIGEFSVDNVEAFFKQSVRNAVVDILRSEKCRRIECSDDTVEFLDTAVTTSTKEIDLLESIEEIHFSRSERKVIMCLIDGKKSAEICEILEITMDNFYKISQRIREKVQDSIE